MWDPLHTHSPSPALQWSQSDLCLVPSKNWWFRQEMSRALFKVGKSLGQQPLVATGHKQPSCLFYVTDHSTGLQFLIDTGSEVSIVPSTPTDCLHQQTRPSLQVVKNTTIVNYGTRSLTLNLGLRRTFRWIFVIANVRKPFLGVDFLQHYKLNGCSSQEAFRCSDSADCPRCFIYRTFCEPFALTKAYT